MALTAERLFIDYSVKKLEQMAGYLGTCIMAVDDELVWRAGPNTNSIGNLVLHLCVNVRQWIGTTLGKLDDIRDRALEFDQSRRMDRAELLRLLKETVEEANGIIGALDGTDLIRVVQTQDGELRVLEVIYQVVGHFSSIPGRLSLP